MSVPVVKGLLWAAIAIAVAMFCAAASLTFGRNESLGLFLGGCVLIVVAILWYRRAITAAEAREEERQAQQLIALKHQLALTGEPIHVQASSGILVLVALVCMLILCGWAALTSPSLGSIGLLAVMALLTVGVAFAFLPRVGKPALVIRPDGLGTALCGFLRWEEIEAIGLQAYTTRGGTTHSLDLYVPRLSERAAQMHPLCRVSQRFVLRRAHATFVVVNLLFPSLPATLVHALCHDLWRQRTGRTRTWTSALPEHHIEQMRRADEQLESLQRLATQTDPAEAMRRLDELEKRFGEHAADRKSRERLSADVVAHRDAMLAEMRTIDPTDRAAMDKVLRKHVDALARERGVKLAILAVVLAAALVCGLVLFG